MNEDLLEAFLAMTSAGKKALEPPLGWRSLRAPRLSPLRRDQLPLIPRVMLRILGKRARVNAPNLFLTLMRHRRLVRPWRKFASTLMPYGTLSRIDCELAILRVAWNCRSKYEWFQHVSIGLGAGLSPTDIARVAEGPDSPAWSAHHAAVLRAADEIHHDRVIADATWRQLAEQYDDKKLIELCMLIGHYEMLASVLNSLGIQVEESLDKRVLAAGIGGPVNDDRAQSARSARAQ
ncbi:carboxymuconolactone decarboxylase family protein [Paraburkholderia sp. 35.1]|uniref:carboxymuconolactone decarboxylase family protein n=1 Tax=Paraburkholderia sp. 35.1 TaxID=2991058 RepID=UPI003D25932B